MKKTLVKQTGKNTLVTTFFSSSTALSSLYPSIPLPSSIDIPEGVTHIGYLAFNDCTALKSAVLPKSVTVIGSGIFSGCTALTSIRVAEENPNYVSDASGVLFNRNKTELVQYPAGRSGIYSAPSGVTDIADHAFHGCSGMERVILPKSVTRLGESAFANCSGGMKLCFLGNAPQTEEYTFHRFSYCVEPFSGGKPYEEEVSDLTVCYTEGSTGWTAPTWNGCPTAIWDGKVEHPNDLP